MRYCVLVYNYKHGDDANILDYNRQILGRHYLYPSDKFLTNNNNNNNSIIYYLGAEPTAARIITDTAQCT
jgi:hypothetical protein